MVAREFKRKIQISASRQLDMARIREAWGLADLLVILQAEDESANEACLGLRSTSSWHRRWSR